MAQYNALQWLCVFYGIDCGNDTYTYIKKNPFHSMAAHCVSVISTSFVAISIVGMTVSTLPALQYQDAQVKRKEELLKTFAFLITITGPPLAQSKYLSESLLQMDSISTEINQTSI